MPKPRKAQVSLQATPYYHCVSRCVRRAFLCGKDQASGVSYEHRRRWIRERMLALARVFSIDICAYAVMPNHYHVVLHVDYEAARDWPAREVIERCHTLFSGADLTLRFLRDEPMSAAEKQVLLQLVALWRTRLMDISCYMRCLNEPIAREDKRGAIAAELPPIMERLQIDPKHWLYMSRHFERRLKDLVGAAYKLKATCKQLGYLRTPNPGACRLLLQ